MPRPRSKKPMNSPVHVIGALFIFGLCALFSRAAAPRLTRRPSHRNKRAPLMDLEDVANSADPDRAEEVRAFYESHPYPAPLRSLDKHRELYRNPDRRRALSFLLWPTQTQRTRREILVAGCGPRRPRPTRCASPMRA